VRKDEGAWHRTLTPTLSRSTRRGGKRGENFERSTSDVERRERLARGG
jgi:hypothetical protein